MNKVIIMGRLTKDPVIRRTAEGKAVAAFDIAVDRRFAGKDAEITTDFFSCSCFGKLAEFVEKYLAKGSKVVLCGELQNNNYTNNKGEKVYATKIIVNEIDFAESKKKETPKDATSDGFIDVPEGIENDLPFK